VRVSLGADGLRMSVKDEGKGINAKVARAGKSGVGIQSMRGRIELVGGKLVVNTGSRGTEVIATIPLSAAGLNGEAGQGLSLPESAQQNQSEHITAGCQRILIADDHPVAREGIRSLLKEVDNIEICGEAVDGLEAVLKTREMRPDLLILDLGLPHLAGFSVARQIRGEQIPTKILIYTTQSYPDLERTARASNLDGFVLKSNAAKDLIRAVKAVLKGGKFFGLDRATRAHYA